jgi:hypothetical protein
MALIVTSVALISCGQAAPKATANRVYGQPDFTSNTPDNGGVSATSLWAPAAAAVDSSGGLYIADCTNNRVLHYPAGSTTADQVYGQPDFTSNAQNNGGLSATSLFSACGVAVDSSGGLYVAEYSNNRVLHYPANSTTADRVYGQPNFTSGTEDNGGISATSLYYPLAVAVDSSGGLYVADNLHNRVLHYPANSTTADRVYGQPDFTSDTPNNGGLSATSLCGPQGVAVDSSGRLYIADSENCRVLFYS